MYNTNIMTRLLGIIAQWSSYKSDRLDIFIKLGPILINIKHCQGHKRCQGRITSSKLISDRDTMNSHDLF
jgi:hypothetical protein